MGKVAGLSLAFFVILIGFSSFSNPTISNLAASKAAGSSPAGPVTATQTSNYNVFYSDYGGNTCYGAGRSWIFYYDGSRIGYVSSSDGLTWTTEQGLNSAGPGTWAFYCSGDVLYYAMSSDPFGRSILYRHGNMSSDGTIHWYGAEGVFNSGGNLIRGISTIVDHSGHWWTTFSDYNSILEVEVWECLTPNSCNWNQTGGWETSDPEHGAIAQILSTNSGTIAVVWTVPNAGGPLSIRFYDGTTWSTTAELPGAFRMGPSTCVSIMNNIGCAESNETAIVYAMASNSNGVPAWSRVVLLTGCSSSLAVQTSIPPYTNCFASASTDGISSIFVTFINSNSTVGSFESQDGGLHWFEYALFTTSETGSPIQISSPAHLGGYVMAAWVSGTSSPYNIKFVEISEHLTKKIHYEPPPTGHS